MGAVRTLTPRVNFPLIKIEGVKEQLKNTRSWCFGRWFSRRCWEYVLEMLGIYWLCSLWLKNGRIPVFHSMLQDVSYFPNFFFTTAHGQQVPLGIIKTFGSIHEIFSIINWRPQNDVSINSTFLKISMEPKNHPMETENHLGFHVNFWGCTIYELIYFGVWVWPHFQFKSLNPYCEHQWLSWTYILPETKPARRSGPKRKQSFSKHPFPQSPHVSFRDGKSQDSSCKAWGLGIQSCNLYIQW